MEELDIPPLSLLGKAVLASHVRRKLEQQYDRTLLEFLSLYANRLRHWMEQSIKGLRDAFNAFADIYRVNFGAAARGIGFIRRIRDSKRSSDFVRMGNHRRGAVIDR